MITEDYVSFEIAKLLKEKGFDEECQQYYGDNKYPCPTLQMAMKWLRKKHNQNVTVKAYNNVARLKTIYYAEVQNLSEPCEKGFCLNGCNFKDTYEEACEATIKYCLENLI